MTLLSVKGISKHFGGVYALKNIDLHLDEGEVLTLLGENGAGKSTLMKVLTGIHMPDSGDIFIKGEEIFLKNPSQARAKGLSIVHQELALANDLTVLENLFLGNNEVNNSLFLNVRKMHKIAIELMDEIGIQLDLNSLVSNLSIAQKQLVEIAKALVVQSDILILDEPSAVLTSEEIENLFIIIRNLQKQGKGIIYISHRLEEIPQIASRIQILKDGESVGTFDPGGTTKEQIIESMIGRTLATMFPKHSAVLGDDILAVKNIKYSTQVKDISFSVKRGEILGFSGLVGSGRTELILSILNLVKKDSGEVFFKNQDISRTSFPNIVDLGIALIPESRRDQGLFIDLPILDNTSLVTLSNYCRSGIISSQDEILAVQKGLDSLNTKYSSLHNPVNSLSGGNQQKVVIGKWLLKKPDLIIFDEPTRGVDVGAKIEIYNAINLFVEAGIGVIVISSELLEIIGICDRVLVIKEGEITKELRQDELSEATIMKYSI